MKPVFLVPDYPVIVQAEPGSESLWLFGFGSLIWRPGFPSVYSSPATIACWSRRFWQGFHDHRGRTGPLSNPDLYALFASVH
jgi:cation transport regulator ChaC